MGQIKRGLYPIFVPVLPAWSWEYCFATLRYTFTAGSDANFSTSMLRCTKILMAPFATNALINESLQLGSCFVHALVVSRAGMAGSRTQANASAVG